MTRQRVVLVAKRSDASWGRWELDVWLVSFETVSALSYSGLNSMWRRDSAVPALCASRVKS